MSPTEFDAYLKVMQDRNVMSCRLILHGDAEVAVTLGPSMPAASGEPAPGAWKAQPSDPHDPDPLGLGPLDAPLAFDEPEVAL